MNNGEGGLTVQIRIFVTRGQVSSESASGGSMITLTSLEKGRPEPAKIMQELMPAAKGDHLPGNGVAVMACGPTTLMDEVARQVPIVLCDIVFCALCAFGSCDLLHRLTRLTNSRVQANIFGFHLHTEIFQF